MTALFWGTNGFNPIRAYRLVASISALLLVLVLISTEAEAQRRPRPRRPDPRSIRTAITGDDSAAYDLRLGDTLDEIVLGGTTTRIYDEFTIRNLERARDLAQPDSSPQDIDPVRTRHLAERALAIETGRNIFRLLAQSELKSEYNSARRGFKSFQDLFRYSVQDNDQGITVSKTTKGKKLIELNLELNTRQGMDPQLSFGENLRFRYDYLDKRPLLEYEFIF